METINIKKIRPLFSAVLTTAEKYEEDETTAGGIIDPTKKKGTLKEYQRVVAVGEYIKNINVGDLVCIDPKDYAIRKFNQNSVKADIMQNEVMGYNFNIVELDGVPHLLLKDKDITFVVEDFEPIEIEVEKKEVKQASPIITSSPLIIT